MAQSSSALASADTFGAVDYRIRFGRSEVKSIGGASGVSVETAKAVAAQSEPLVSSADLETAADGQPHARRIHDCPHLKTAGGDSAPLSVAARRRRRRARAARRREDACAVDCKESDGMAKDQELEASVNDLAGHVQLLVTCVSWLISTLAPQFLAPAGDAGELAMEPEGEPYAGCFWHGTWAPHLDFGAICTNVDHGHCDSEAIVEGGVACFKAHSGSNVPHVASAASMEVRVEGVDVDATVVSEDIIIDLGASCSRLPHGGAASTASIFSVAPVVESHVGSSSEAAPLSIDEDLQFVNHSAVSVSQSFSDYDDVTLATLAATAAACWPVVPNASLAPARVSPREKVETLRERTAVFSTDPALIGVDELSGFFPAEASTLVAFGRGAVLGSARFVLRSGMGIGALADPPFSGAACAEAHLMQRVKSDGRWICDCCGDEPKVGIRMRVCDRCDVSLCPSCVSEVARFATQLAQSYRDARAAYHVPTRRVLQG